MGAATATAGFTVEQTSSAGAGTVLSRRRTRAGSLLRRAADQRLIELFGVRGSDAAAGFQQLWDRVLRAEEDTLDVDVEGLLRIIERGVEIVPGMRRAALLTIPFSLPKRSTVYEISSLTCGSSVTSRTRVLLSSVSGPEGPTRTHQIGNRPTVLGQCSGIRSLTADVFLAHFRQEP